MSDQFWKMKKAYAQMNGTAQRQAAKAQAKPTEPEREQGPLWFVSGHVEPSGSEFAAIASAIPNNGPQSAQRTLTRVFATQELADAAVAQLKQELGASIVVEGGRVY